MLSPLCILLGIISALAGYGILFILSEIWYDESEHGWDDEDKE